MNPQILVGLTEQKATELAKQYKLAVRILQREETFYDCDYSCFFDRVSLYIQHGLVYKVEIG